MNAARRAMLRIVPLATASWAIRPVASFLTGTRAERLSAGQRPPLLNSVSIFTLVIGLVSFAPGLVIRNVRSASLSTAIAATATGLVAMLVGLCTQIMPATRDERVLLVTGIIGGFVGFRARPGARRLLRLRYWSGCRWAAARPGGWGGTARLGHGAHRRDDRAGPRLNTCCIEGSAGVSGQHLTSGHQSIPSQTGAHVAPPADCKVVKPTPPELMEDTGTGLDYGTRPDRMPGYLVPNDRFYIRSHAPTPQVDVADWTLRIQGNGVGQPVTYSYDELWNQFPLVSVIRTIECAGNRRVLLGNEFASKFEGTQWGRGAIGTAEWTGVRLRDLLEPADLTPGAREIMPESLDEIRARRPMPLAKARADDTLVALAMNGEILPADHGFPARVVVSGWLGAASIKWLARIEVSEERLYVPWNTEDYVLIGSRYPSDYPARGLAITTLPISALTELPWPARLRPEPQMIRGRAFAGENAIATVEYRIDDGPWRPAELGSPDIPGAWVRWQFAWTPEPGDHVLRARATDERGNTQPDASEWNELGYLQHSVLSHPVHVEPAPTPRTSKKPRNRCGKAR
jgi:DMSO/TMAO reductase YedYZ molybdopterin-dependent catalytic subunit